MRIKTLWFMFLVFWIPVTTEAAVMDFSTAPLGSFQTAPYEQNGIRLTLLRGHYDIFDCNVFGLPSLDGTCPFLGLDSVNTGTATVRISMVSGNPFDLNRVDFPLSPAVWVGTERNSLASSKGVLLFFISDISTLVNPAGFDGITYFDIESTVNIAGGFTLDNITVTEIPEPASWTMIAAAGVVLALRNRLCKA